MKRTRLFASTITRSILTLCFLFCAIVGFSQLKTQSKDKTKPAVTKTESTPIHIIHANKLEFNKRLGEGAERLIGNVQLEDDGVFMNCDSAYLFPDNSLRAFSNV